jgi:hypothetical protein
MDLFDAVVVASVIWLIDKIFACNKQPSQKPVCQPAYQPDYQQMGIDACDDGIDFCECPFGPGEAQNDWCGGWAMEYEGMHGKAALDEYMRKGGWVRF